VRNALRDRLLGWLAAVMLLGNIFESSDNCELAVKILRNPGYLWMAAEPYGVLINLVVKLFVGTASALGVTVTEFVWKLPVAILGALYVPLAYLFLRRLGATRFGAKCGAAFLAVLPVHVGQSRYLWGYETLGALCVMLAFWALVAFFERPNRRRSVVASVAIALYLISHGYIIPFFPCLAVLIIAFTPDPKGGWGRRLLTGCLLMARRFVWVGPLLVSPLCYHSVKHALGKRSRLGFYFFDHLGGFLGNTGLILGLLAALVVLLALADRFLRARATICMALCGGIYLAPLILGVPPDVTVVRGYMLLGTCFWVFCLALALDRLSLVRPTAVKAVAIVCFVVTLWSAVETIFGRDQVFDPNLAVIERGDVPPDIGTKAAGYLIRKHLPSRARVLAIHRALEPPNVFYYFGKGPQVKSFSDLPLETRAGTPFDAQRSRDTREAFARYGSGADVVICEEAQLPYVRASRRFVETIVLHSEGHPRMWIFARPDLGLPASPRADVREFNQAFDREHAPKVRLW